MVTVTQKSDEGEPRDHCAPAWLKAGAAGVWEAGHWAVPLHSPCLPALTPTVLGLCLPRKPDAWTLLRRQLPGIPAPESLVFLLPETLKELNK